MQFSFSSSPVFLFDTYGKLYIFYQSSRGLYIDILLYLWKYLQYIVAKREAEILFDLLNTDLYWVCCVFVCLLHNAACLVRSGTARSHLCIGRFLREHGTGMGMNRQPVQRVTERVCGGAWKGLFSPRSASAPIRCSWMPEAQRKRSACFMKLYLHTKHRPNKTAMLCGSVDLETCSYFEDAPTLLSQAHQ